MISKDYLRWYRLTQADMTPQYEAFARKLNFVKLLWERTYKRVF